MKSFKIIRNVMFPILPAKVTPRGPCSLPGIWWFETLPQRGLAGGSKYRAYIRARNLFASGQRYAGTGDGFIPFRGPIGILP